MGPPIIVAVAAFLWVLLKTALSAFALVYAARMAWFWTTERGACPVCGQHAPNSLSATTPPNRPIAHIIDEIDRVERARRRPTPATRPQT